MCRSLIMDQPRAAGRGRGARGRQRRDEPQGSRNAWGVPLQPQRRSAPAASPRVANGDADSQHPAPAVSRKFEEACAKIQANMEKFLPPTQDDQSSSEEELETEGILSRVVGSYSELSDKGSGDLQRTVQFLTDNLVSGAVVCLICIENVKRTERVWSCGACYGVLHLACVQKWAKDSMFQQQQQQQQQEAVTEEKLQWHCPKCRKDYSSRQGLDVYRCFCGQKVNPEYDPWLVPHSCGQTCSRKLQPACGHHCLLLCHPGPCPPCPKMVQSTCHCGKAQPTARRCSSRLWSCGKPCGKLLSCTQHRCELTCHSGDCRPCPRKSQQACLCGASKTDRPCADPTWQCQKVCGKLLSCRQHRCETVCHKGACLSCPRSGPRECPCGKTKWELPCTEDVGVCGDTCDKLLACGIHHCSQRCHAGSCPPCLQIRPKRCRCGAREKEVPCSREYTCETKCKRLRDCRRHPCSRKCCDGSCPPCEQPCGRALPCKNHRCSSCCHMGPCYPCHEKVELACRCKATKIAVPCGRERSAKAPTCHQPCRIPPECHHEKRDPHKCHDGRCPPCAQICNRSLQCGHICRARCHSAVWTKIVPKQGQRVGPWEPLAAIRMEVVSQPCPPCPQPMQLACRGNHCVSTFPCSELRPHSCGRPCGRSLTCGNHTCAYECHIVEDAPSDTQAGYNCSPCEEDCQKPRPPGCNHPCNKPCHPGDCAPCTQYIKMKCHCGLNPIYVSCHQWTASDSTEAQAALQSCKNRCCKQLACSHRCPLTCHPGECAPRSQCRKRVTVRCPCKRRKAEGPCSELKESLNCNDKCRSSVQEQDLEAREVKAEPQEKIEGQWTGHMRTIIALSAVALCLAVTVAYWSMQ